MVEQPKKPDSETLDANMKHIMDAAGECLAHVRAVSWGEGNTNYETDDGRARLLVSISVRTISTAKGKPVEQIDTP